MDCPPHLAYGAAMPDTIDWKQAGAEAISLLKDLLRLNTTNPPGNERLAADYIAALLTREGIEFQMLSREPSRANIVARIRGSGTEGPLLLNGHLDVVPAEAAKWKHDPFGGEEIDGYIWGRGAIDMKNMVAMSLMTLILVKRLNLPLKRDLILAAVADEEAGSRYGALYLTEEHPELVRAQYVLNEVGGHTLHMKGTRFYPIQVSERGICWFELKAHGDPGHGSMPHPHNAVVRLARAISALGRVRMPQHNTTVVEAFIKKLASHIPFPENKILPLLLSPRLSGPVLDLLQKQNLEQAIALNALLRNTVSPTMLSAGSKVNVIPSSASAQLDGRILPGQTRDDFLREVQQIVGDDLKVTVLEHHDGTIFSADTPLFDTICRTLEKSDPGCVPVPYMIPGFTDSFAYGKLGAICYGFSPVQLPEDLNFARMYHGHNERIPKDGYLWGLRVLYDVVSQFCQ